ncbi:MAG: HlyD family efflux transporter periplasmic adaptor subunit [Cyclobacteriaceae bacterium]|nr:HlyD family efflux transporter periplasmic adaptor subunit [Cyclobacteriaceae bacterium]
MRNLLFIIFIVFVSSCNTKDTSADAWGNFEADERIISSESTGKIVTWNVIEGQKISIGDIIAVIDTSQLSLQKRQVEASIGAIRSKIQNVDVQLAAYLEQKAHLSDEIKRVEALLRDSAATQKQYDDLKSNYNTLEKQIEASSSRLSTVNRGILSEIKPLELKIEQLEDLILKSVVRSPSNGTVLISYVNLGEVAVFGRPLLKMADLENIYFRGYVSGNQLHSIKLGGEVMVGFDVEEGVKKVSGHVSWISEEAEFTPKAIQTKEERVNQVYGVKVLIKNDGSMKIGMPGELFLLAQDQSHD